MGGKRPRRAARRAMRPQADALCDITVKGFKSFADSTNVQLLPLTILAGGNSSGKSSIMQPLLLLKQTLEAQYDPGPLLLDGPNVKYTSADQLLTRGKSQHVKQFSVGFGFQNGRSVGLEYRRSEKRGFRISAITHADSDRELPIRLTPSMDSDQIGAVIPEIESGPLRSFLADRETEIQYSIDRNRCFLNVTISVGGIQLPEEWSERPVSRLEEALTRSIHLPGLRGNPERAYPSTSVGQLFPGQFQDYVASIIHYWQEEKPARVARIAAQLSALGLTWKLQAEPIDDTRVELKVGRLPRAQQGGAWDLVSLADVGLGVSQVLPVLVALEVAEAGQIVMIEQPEIHLHPRAQGLLAQPIVDASRRGVQVIVETHSVLLLRSIQTAVARGELSPDIVSLNWFWRDPVSGGTQVEAAELGENGSFGTWPEDLAVVGLETELEYLDAASPLGN